MKLMKFRFFAMLVVLGASSVAYSDYSNCPPECASDETACEFHFKYGCTPPGTFDCCYCAQGAADGASQLEDCLDSNGVPSDMLDVGNGHYLVTWDMPGCTETASWGTNTGPNVPSNERFTVTLTTNGDFDFGS